jgi:ubiquinone/menaquinone biosynthesis C-methylase UbiE
MSYVYMKVLETAPTRYDRGMRILTLGRLARVHGEIGSRLAPGSQVLDIGCGTGTLAVQLAGQGIDVTGIDVSAPMLHVARRKVESENLQGSVTLRQMGIVDLDRAFPDGCFDAVIGTLVFSELSEDEMSYGLKQCRRVLRAGGKLFVADEVRPESFLGRLLMTLIRVPFALLAFLLTQSTTRWIGGLRQRIEAEGFRTRVNRYYLARSLQLLVAEKA